MTAIAGCGVAAAMLAGGCSRDGTVVPTESAASPSTPVATSTAPGASSPPTQATSAPPTKRSPAPRTTRPRSAAKRCDIADLTVTLRGEDGAAGTLYRGLVFTNTGRRTCTIQGFPGVSFVTGDDGHQVGQPGDWDGPTGPVITLTRGKAATATLAFPNVGNWDPDDCLPTDVRGLRVYPPHDTRAEFVPLETTACAGKPPGGHLSVRAVHPGTDLS
ncbi:DUF4232 domain-containing protein [Flindersiella endophytica]